MKTIHINQKAAVLALGSLFIIVLVIFYSITPNIDDAVPVGRKMLLARDINARANFPLEKLRFNEVSSMFLYVF